MLGWGVGLVGEVGAFIRKTGTATGGTEGRCEFRQHLGPGLHDEHGRCEHGLFKGPDGFLLRTFGLEQSITPFEGAGVVPHRGEVGGVRAADRGIEPAPTVGGRASDQAQVVGAEDDRGEASQMVGDGGHGIAVDERLARTLRQAQFDRRAFGARAHVEAEARLGAAHADERRNLRGAEGAESGDEGGGLQEVGLALAVLAQQENAGSVGVDVGKREVAEVSRADAGDAHGLLRDRQRHAHLQVGRRRHLVAIGVEDVIGAGGRAVGFVGNLGERVAGDNHIRGEGRGFAVVAGGDAGDGGRTFVGDRGDARGARVVLGFRVAYAPGKLGDLEHEFGVIVLQFADQRGLVDAAAGVGLQRATGELLDEHLFGGLDHLTDDRALLRVRLQTQVLVEVVDRRQGVLQVEVHAAGLEVRFRSTLAGIDDFEEGLQGFPRLALLLVSHALPEFAVFEFRSADRRSAIPVATDEGERASEAEKGED